MKIRFFNNWRYKRHWPNTFDYKFSYDRAFSIKYLRLGLLGFFLLVQWNYEKKKTLIDKLF